MGNIDKVVIFNKSFGIVVLGRDYQNEPEVVEIALKRFQTEAQASVDMWYQTQKEHPEMVEPSYRPEDELEVRSIEVYDIHS